ncbi:MAG: hypothetical protein JKY99_08430 [Rhizobiales bacterium]|nr:hypothetical protein [Hyphomicrobiales bacterium]
MSHTLGISNRKATQTAVVCIALLPLAELVTHIISVKQKRKKNVDLMPSIVPKLGSFWAVFSFLWASDPDFMASSVIYGIPKCPGQITNGAYRFANHRMGIPAGRIKF